MTVAELIEELQKFMPQQSVLIVFDAGATEAEVLRVGIDDERCALIAD